MACSLFPDPNIFSALATKVRSLSHSNAKRSDLLMKERLGTTIHWAGFFFGGMAVVGSDVGGIQLIIFLLLSWAIKYALTGRKGFFPWN
jgi:hypothetical protein